MKGTVQKMEWISVKERMPETFLSVLGLLPKEAEPYPRVRECFLISDEDEEFYFPVLGESFVITHWMPLPKPPNEVGDENA